MRICQIKGCGKKYEARRYCSMHYSRLRKTNSTQRRTCINKGECKVKGCNNKQRIRHYCDKHYAKFRKYGNPYTVINKGWGSRPHYHILRKNRSIILINHPTCEICKEKSATETHHKDESISNHSLNNLQAVCRSCHTLHHSKYRRLYGITIQELSNKLNIPISTAQMKLQKGEIK